MQAVSTLFESKMEPNKLTSSNETQARDNGDLELDEAVADLRRLVDTGRIRNADEEADDWELPMNPDPVLSEMLESLEKLCTFQECNDDENGYASDSSDASTTIDLTERVQGGHDDKNEYGSFFSEALEDSDDDEDWEVSDFEFPPIPVWMLSKRNEDIRAPTLTKCHTMASLYWYVRNSTQDFIQEIVSTEDFRDIPKLVECMMNLPIEYDSETFNVFREVIFCKVLLRDIHARDIPRLAEFWCEINFHSRRGTSSSEAALKLKLDYVSQICTILSTVPAGASESKELELEFLTEQELQLKRASECENVKMHQKKLKVIQEQHLERAMTVGQLVIELYSKGVISSTRILQTLVNLSRRSDATAAHLIVMFLEEIGRPLETYFFGGHHAAFKMPLDGNQKGLAQIYGKLSQIANRRNHRVISPYVQHKAKELVQEKVAALTSASKIISRQKSYTSESKETLCCFTEVHYEIFKNKKAAKTDINKPMGKQPPKKRKHEFNGMVIKLPQLNDTFLSMDLVDEFLNLLLDQRTQF